MLYLLLRVNVSITWSLTNCVRWSTKHQNSFAQWLAAEVLLVLRYLLVSKKKKGKIQILGELQYNFSLYLNINQVQLYSWFGEWLMHNAENGIVFILNTGQCFLMPPLLWVCNGVLPSASVFLLVLLSPKEWSQGSSEKDPLHPFSPTYESGALE